MKRDVELHTYSGTIYGETINCDEFPPVIITKEHRVLRAYIHTGTREGVGLYAECDNIMLLLK